MTGEMFLVGVVLFLFFDNINNRVRISKLERNTRSIIRKMNGGLDG